MKEWQENKLEREARKRFCKKTLLYTKKFYLPPVTGKDPAFPGCEGGQSRTDPEKQLRTSRSSAVK